MYFPASFPFPTSEPEFCSPAQSVSKWSFFLHLFQFCPMFSGMPLALGKALLHHTSTILFCMFHTTPSPALLFFSFPTWWCDIAQFHTYAPCCCCCSCFSPYFVNFAFPIVSFTLHEELIRFYATGAFSFHSPGFHSHYQHSDLSSEAPPDFKTDHKRPCTEWGSAGLTPR